MKLDQLAPEALRLPIRDRALLAASLWESIGDPYTLLTDHDDAEAIALAEARDNDLESGQIAALSHQDLMQRLRG